MLVKKIIVSTLMAVTLAASAGSAFAGTVTNVGNRSTCNIPSKICFGKHRMNMENRMSKQAVTNPSTDKSRVDFRVSNRHLGDGGVVVMNAETKTSADPRVSTNL